ncbi:uncharacterized protein I206_104690 [Kwoniella pini CBS 10737]|uniref:Uncharacterized protein n=1 Tax=Kwoniella pini CBS 10737 TaxID=1296096 RepID=A0A1B9I7L8_9TREE|nr:uncharacterized protein I206_02228 [Kwoniella pini CBS 10737]OCF51514.1 hypothetical protein I206_02228 [Kwoniella pini CBS 10737]
MTKLSSTFSYKFLKKWDNFLRIISIKRIEIWSDASGKGYGGHLGPQSKPLDLWKDTHNYFLKNNNNVNNNSIELIEAKALFLSLKKWSNQLKGKKVWCYIDNFQVYKILNLKYSTFSSPPISLFLNNNNNNKRKKYLFFNSNLILNLPFIIKKKSYFNEISKKNSKSPQIKKIFEEIDELIKEYEITIKARWVWGKDNFLADKLSRIGNGNFDLNRNGNNNLTPHVLELLKIASSANSTKTDTELGVGVGVGLNNSGEDARVV